MSQPHSSLEPDTFASLCPARRDLILTMLAIPGAAALAGCGSDDEANKSTNKPANDTKAAGKTDTKADKAAQKGGGKGSTDVAKGSAALASVDGKSMIVTRDAQDNYIGYPTVCTHEEGSLAPSGSEIVCSLHGGKFSLDGKPASGPPQNPLKATKLKKTDTGFTIAS